MTFFILVVLRLFCLAVTGLTFFNAESIGGRYDGGLGRDTFIFDESLTGTSWVDDFELGFRGDVLRLMGGSVSQSFADGTVTIIHGDGV